MHKMWSGIGLVALVCGEWACTSGSDNLGNGEQALESASTDPEKAAFPEEAESATEPPVPSGPASAQPPVEPGPALTRIERVSRTVSRIPEKRRVVAIGVVGPVVLSSEEPPAFLGHGAGLQRRATTSLQLDQVVCGEVQGATVLSVAYSAEWSEMPTLSEGASYVLVMEREETTYFLRSSYDVLGLASDGGFKSGDVTITKPQMKEMCQ